MRWVMHAKIHKATVTEANLDYVGSITIDAELLGKTGIWPGEKVQVVDNTNGARLETYVIPGEPGSGVICMNGAAAHLIGVGDEIIIIAYKLSDEPIADPKVILVDEQNQFERYM